MVDIIKKKLIPTVVIFVLVLSSFCLPVFAEGDENIINDNLNSWLVDSNSTTEPDITYSNGSNSLYFDDSVRSDYVAYYSIPSVNYNHSLTLSFLSRGYFSLFNLTVYLQNGDDSNIHVLTTIDSGQSANVSHSFTFTPSSIFSNISSLKIVFEFNVTSNSHQRVYLIDISLIDNTGDSPAYSGLTGAIYNYIQPSINWGFSQISSFFEVIESEWYYLFIWYVLNSALIILIVGHSVFEWIDIFHEGMLSWGIHKYSDNKNKAQFDKIRALRVQEAQNRYELRRQKITEDWEVRNYMYKQKGFMTFAEAKEKVIELKKNRDKNSSSNDK